MASKEPDKTGDNRKPSVQVPWYRQLLAIKNTLIIIITPIVFSPLVIAYPTPQGKCAYGIIIVAIFWMTECLPLAVTAIMPVVLMTWLGVMDSRDICKNYLKDANFLFLGGLMIAISIEKWGLHKRVALRVLMLVGSKPVWITFGFMGVTGFLSMWLANVPTAAMMIPIAAAVLKALDDHRMMVRQLRREKRLEVEMKSFDGDQKSSDAEAGDKAAGSAVVELDGTKKPSPSANQAEATPQSDADVKEWTSICEKEDSEFRCFACALKLGVSYSATIGGTATIIGSGPNIVLKGQLESFYGPNTGVNFFSFLVFAFPYTIIALVTGWFVLVCVLVGPRKAFFPEHKDEEQGEHSANAVIRSEYAKLGPITWPEAWVLGLFCLLAAMWVTKNPQFVNGWADYMGHNFVTDSVCAVTISLALFILPSRKPNYLCFRKTNDPTPPQPAPPLLDWQTVHSKMQWGVIFLLGGGFAIADAVQASNLGETIAEFLSSFRAMPQPIIGLLVVCLSLCITCFSSNVASATLFIPIVAELAIGVHINPLYLMFPVAIAVNISYLLPVSTPCNAIVYAYGDIRVSDMLKVGSISTVLHLIILLLAINTWAYAFFELGHFPKWAGDSVLDPVANATLGNGTSPLLSTTAAALVGI